MRKREAVQLDFVGEESRTHQSFKESTDINNIVRKVGIGEQPPQQFVDCTRYGDYMEMQNKVAQVKDYFSRLPGRVRAEFDNDPAAFVSAANQAFASEDESEYDRFVQMGIFPPKPEAAPEVPPPPAPESPPSPAESGGSDD